MMLVYSALLSLGLVLSAPWWLLRMATTQRYREGLGERLGFVPLRVREFVAGRRIVWVHAVSVGEVLAVSRLVAELEAALGEGWAVVVSTTTRTGQALARERFGAERVFYYPLDFAFAVRLYLRLLHAEAIVLAESEVWPRMLHEARKLGVPVAVVNARVSDRSFARGLKVRSLWAHVLRMPRLWLAQSEEDVRRLVTMGARAAAVRVGGNLKYDVWASSESRVADLIRSLANGRAVIVAGSTCASLIKKTEFNVEYSEEQMVVNAWARALRFWNHSLLVIAPRHPERFAEVEAIAQNYSAGAVSHLLHNPPDAEGGAIEVLLLDTIGDLAAVYGIADVAFVGGSLVKRGGHSPLEPAQFGVPVVIGPSFENFRDVVGKMQAKDGIRIAENADGLETALVELLTDRAAARAMGERGRQVFEAQQGATTRAVEAILAMMKGAKA